MKEDEKNEKLIRKLLKLPENRRCINCNSLGPQYVCTNFWTFVCITCSGTHREFTHRVKSVSMAKFTSQEVRALQEGGNQRAKEIYFKEWDPQRHSLPDSSDLLRLRDFIRHVYVDRRYTGVKSVDRPLRVKMVDREASYTSRSDPRSPVYEDTYESRYGERSGSGRGVDKNSKFSSVEKSPGYGQESQKYGNHQRSLAVDNKLRDAEDNRYSDGEAKPGGKSPSHQKDMYSSNPPVVRPVRDILAESVSSLRLSEPPKAYGGRAAALSAHTQRSSSSGSLGSTQRNSVQLKRASSGGLINFSAAPKLPEVAAAPQTQQTLPSTGPSLIEPMTSSINDGNWAVFDSPAQEKVSQAPSNTETLDSMLSQLFVPAAAPVGDLSILSPPLPKLTPDTGSAVVSGLEPSEVKSGARKLPEDLFAATYSSVPGWQAVPTVGMGYSMHVPPFPQSSYPFGHNNVTTFAQAPSPQTFPSMTPLQGAVPNVSLPTGLLRSASVGSSSIPWTSAHSSFHTGVMPVQPPPYTLGRSPIEHMGQQTSEFRTNQQHGSNLFPPPATQNFFSSVRGNPFE